MSIEEKIENLTNEGMIDTMLQDLTDFRKSTWRTLYFPTWQSWIRS